MNRSRTENVTIDGLHVIRFVTQKKLRVIMAQKAAVAVVLVLL
jgi:hypothetical protein